LKIGEDPLQFDSDCREGAYGTCELVINGVSHGEQQQTSTCQLYMRHFQNGKTIKIEPFPARAVPVIKDLVIDRSAFDRIMQQGGSVSINMGNAPEANAIVIRRNQAMAQWVWQNALDELPGTLTCEN
jgi:succinate dehydrogenase / fumarate reductase, iron-sulfur subunit